MVDEQEFWYGIDGERHGPVSRDELRALVASGRLGEGDWLWDEEREDWRPLHEYPELLRGGQVPPPPPGGPHAPGSGDADFGGAAPPPVAWEPRHGGFLPRLAAWVVDMLVLMMPSLLWGMYCVGATGIDPANVEMFDFLQERELREGEPTADLERFERFRDMLQFGIIAIIWVYGVAMEASPWQATAGKRLMGLVVTDDEGRRPTLWRVALRRSGWFISYFFAPLFLLIAFTARRQGLHDMIARTLVLRR